ncbi:MAG: hypothetical protein GEU73_12690 [Chloroflexi bacterium]|nr:hypothetical protein [Chloroflexota bacterium]
MPVQQRWHPPTWLVPAALVTTGVIGLAMVAVVAVAAWSAIPKDGTVFPSVGLGERVVEEPIAPESEPTVVPSVTSIPEATATPERTPTATPTPSRAEFVRIANTGGAGAFIRAEPRSNAQGIRAYRDGTVLKVVGQDVPAGGQVWRNVEDQQGNRGWTPDAYLLPSPTGF